MANSTGFCARRPSRRSDMRATLADLREMDVALDRDHDDGLVLDLTQQQDLSVYDAVANQSVVAAMG